MSYTSNLRHYLEAVYPKIKASNLDLTFMKFGRRRKKPSYEIFLECIEQELCKDYKQFMATIEAISEQNSRKR